MSIGMRVISSKLSSRVYTVICPVSEGSMTGVTVREVLLLRPVVAVSPQPAVKISEVIKKSKRRSLILNLITSRE